MVSFDLLLGAEARSSFSFFHRSRPDEFEPGVLLDCAVSWNNRTSCSPATREGDKSEDSLDRIGMASWWLTFFHVHTHADGALSLEQLCGEENTLRG